jgi:hypothetical protein
LFLLFKCYRSKKVSKRPNTTGKFEWFSMVPTIPTKLSTGTKSPSQVISHQTQLNNADGLERNTYGSTEWISAHNTTAIFQISFWDAILTCPSTQGKRFQYMVLYTTQSLHSYLRRPYFNQDIFLTYSHKVRTVLRYGTRNTFFPLLPLQKMFMRTPSFHMVMNL